MSARLKQSIRLFEEIPAPQVLILLVKKHSGYSLPCGIFHWRYSKRIHRLAMRPSEKTRTQDGIFYG